MKKTNKILLIIITIVAVLALLVTGLFLLLPKEEVQQGEENVITKKEKKVEQNTEEVTKEIENTVQNSITEEDGENKPVEENEDLDTSDWLTYKNEEYGVSFKYPRGKKVIEEEIDPEIEISTGEYYIQIKDILGIKISKNENDYNLQEILKKGDLEESKYAVYKNKKFKDNEGMQSFLLNFESASIIFRYAVYKEKYIYAFDFNIRPELQVDFTEDEIEEGKLKDYLNTLDIENYPQIFNVLNTLKFTD